MTRWVSRTDCGLIQDGESMVVCHYGCDVVVGSFRWFGSAALARQSCDADQTRRRSAFQRAFAIALEHKEKVDIH
jgi:hypothetical protein